MFKLINIFTILVVFFTSHISEATQTKVFIARVTYYWPGGGGQSGKKTATGNIARSNKTMAVDPKIITYGSKITIPKMNKVFVAHDTGSAIKKRTASKKLGKNNIVVDVFCENRKEAMYKIKTYPMFMTIKVEPK